MQILGLDVGDHINWRSDDSYAEAGSVETIRQIAAAGSGPSAGVVTQYGTDTLVIGLPKIWMVQKETGATVREFGETLQQTFRDIRIIFWDERLSTVAAARSLIAADVSRAGRKKVIDKMAAVFILQGILTAAVSQKVWLTSFFYISTMQLAVNFYERIELCDG